MMFRKLSLVFTLLLTYLSINSSLAETHSIKNLSHKTVPATPRQGEGVDSLNLNFKLVSSDGLDESRFRLLINELEQNLNGSTVTFSNNVLDPDAGTETADVKIETFNQIFNKVNNDLTLQYLISKDTTENPRDERTIKNIVAIPTENIDANGNSTAATIINLSIEDSLETLMASSTSRFIRVTARHDKRIIPAVTGDNFNAVTNPITKNIKVKRIQKKVKTNVTNEFSFNLESESIELADNLLQTVFITNPFQVLEKQELEFKINLRSFYASTGLDLGTKVLSVDKESLSFTAATATISSSSISEALVFNTLSSKGAKHSLSSNDVVLNLNYSLSDNGVALSEIDQIKFFTKKKGKKTKPKIRASKNIGVSILNSAATSFSGDSNMLIPIKLSLKSSSSKLEKKGFLNSSISKSLKIPMKIFARDTNGVEVILQGEQVITTDMSFNLPE